MHKQNLSIAIGNYDRCRPLFDGKVQIDGVNPIFMHLPPEEIFFRAFRSSEFDVCELSLSSSVVKAVNGSFDYVGIPVFLSRAFRHTSVYVRKDRIKKPEDLIGKKIGVPEYQLTANVWARAFLWDGYGIKPSDVTWVRGGISEPGRPEKIKLKLPDNIKVEDCAADETISQLLVEGKIDGYIAPRPPVVPKGTASEIGWLFDDPTAEAKAYFKRTGIFPIMHIVGVRRQLADQYPWLPFAIYKAFSDAKHVALEHLLDTSATKVTMPFVEERMAEARQLMGDDFWSYGVEANKHVLETFFRHHHLQGLSSRELRIDELFGPSVMESFVI